MRGRTDPHLPLQLSFHPLPGSWWAGPAARTHSSPRYKYPQSLKKRCKGPIKQTVNHTLTLLRPLNPSKRPHYPLMLPRPGSPPTGPSSFLVLQAPLPLKCFQRPFFFFF